MPTGYTAAILDGIDFKTYAMNCARAFGAFVELRDDPGGGEQIPEEFKASDYHIKAAAKACDELATLHSLSREQIEQAAASDWQEKEARRLAREQDRRKQREAYEAMLAQAKAWTPPTTEHEGLAKFMRVQIELSIRFDCDYSEPPTENLAGSDWVADRRRELMRDVEYHEREHVGEVSRATARTAWVQALRASLE